MPYHVIEEYGKMTDIDAMKESFMEKICSKCTQRYECMTNGYRMRFTDKYKFVLINSEERKPQVECYHMQK